MDFLEQIIPWLEEHGILALLAALITSVLSMILVSIKTRTSSIQKKAVINNTQSFRDYYVVIPGLGVYCSMANVGIVSKADLKLLDSNYKEV